MALALEWVARIMAVALIMVVPGLAGQWLDRKLGTGFLVLLGFGIGLPGGMGCLLLMTRQSQNKKSSRSVDEDSPP